MRRRHIETVKRWVKIFGAAVVLLCFAVLWHFCAHEPAGVFDGDY